MESFLERIAALWRPHPGQRAFLLAQAPTKLLACGRRWGKTDACAIDLLHLLTRPKPLKGFVVAPTLTQAGIIFDRLIELVEKTKLLFGLPDPKVRLSPYPSLELGDHRIVARSAHRPRSLRGHEANHIVVDEAAYVADRTVDEVLSPMLATTDGTLVMASTPAGFNHFWRRFVRNEDESFRYQGPSEENDRIRPDFLRLQRSILSERSYRVEYEASFESGEGQVFPLEAIDIAQEPREEEARGQVFIGVDWGRHEDYTAVAVVQGTRERAWVREIRRIRRMPMWETAYRFVADVVARYPDAFLRCDSTGTQDAQFDGLRRECPNAPVEGFDFGGGRKAQLVNRLCALFDRRALAIPLDPILREELLSFTARRTGSGHMKYEAATGHDDLVMALGLAVYDLPFEGAPGVLLGDQRRF